MTNQLTMTLEDAPEVVAPDGLRVRPLNVMRGGGMAQFRLPASRTGRTIRHRRIEEIWYVVEGEGEFWREGMEGGRPVVLTPGTCVSVPPRRAFQVRAGRVDLVIIAVTMPPWPGEDEAEVLDGAGPWMPSP